MRHFKSNEIRPDAPGRSGLSPTEPHADEVATELHASLLLDQILCACRRLLSEHFGPNRISLVQYRGGTTTATVCSLDEEANPAVIKPRVVPLEPSRLGRCFGDRVRLLTDLQDAAEQDAMEKDLLLRPETRTAIYLPLVQRDQIKGVLVLGLTDRMSPSPNQLAFLDTLAHHLSLALENSDIHYLERRRGRQLATVSEIAKQAVQCENLGDFLPSAAELLRQGLNYDVVQIWTVGAQQGSLGLRGYAHKAQIDGIAGASIPSIVEECRRQGQSICNNSLLGDASDSPGRPLIASRLAAPIRLRGKILGVLSIESCRLGAFPPEDIVFLEGTASLIASAFDNIRVLESTQQSNDYMRAILDSARDMAILSTDNGGYLVMSSSGAKTIFHLNQQEILGRNILSLFTDEGFQADLAAYLGNPAISSLKRNRLPQTSGKAESYLDLTFQRVQDPEQRSLGFLCIVRDVTETVLLQQMLEAMSMTDELTGINNQRRFFSSLSIELERSLRYSRDLSLCFIDLDGFKKYNDTHGHLQGDQALKDTANLAVSMVRSGVDTCYRYGGDEFVIVMPETGMRNAQNLAERLRTRLSEQFKGEITASIGIAQADGCVTAEELVDLADKAMYQSKSRGGNRITLAVNRRFTGEE